MHLHLSPTGSMLLLIHECLCSILFLHPLEARRFDAPFLPYQKTARRMQHEHSSTVRSKKKPLSKLFGIDDHDYHCCAYSPKGTLLPRIKMKTETTPSSTGDGTLRGDTYRIHKHQPRGSTAHLTLTGKWAIAFQRALNIVFSGARKFPRGSRMIAGLSEGK